MLLIKNSYVNIIHELNQDYDNMSYDAYEDYLNNINDFSRGTYSDFLYAYIAGGEL